MYDCIYGKLEEGGIIEGLESPVLMNKAGDIVDTEDGAYGLPVEFNLKWPHLVNFMDETGCDTNQKKDGQIGRSHYITEKGRRVELQAITSDVRWTVLPIHNARGEAVCCVIMFQSDAKNIPFNWTTGIDPTMDVDPGMLNTESETWIRDNFGPGKLMPGGPICTINDIDIPTHCTHSPHGGVTTDTLVDIFKYLDATGIFPRGAGGQPNPAMICDGHDSRMKLPFLRYVNNEEHEWNINVGVPYNTETWQHHDSKQMNGNFKTNFYKAKEQLARFKLRHNLPLKFKPTDIVPLVNAAWKDSFDNVQKAKTSLADRGWNPLNRATLTYPEILSTRTTQQRMSAAATSMNLNLNLDEGDAADIIDTTLNKQDAEKRLQRNLEKKRRADESNTVVKKAKQLTSGMLAAAGVHHLGKDQLEQMENWEADRKQKVSAKIEKDQAEENELWEKVENTRGKLESSWKKPDYDTMVMFKKIAGDSPKEKKIGGLKRQWEARKNRPDPIRRFPPMPPLNDSYPVLDDPTINGEDEDAEVDARQTGTV